MVDLRSEAIAEITYDGETATLFVRFMTGGCYAYFDVPASVHRAFLAAPSHGGFFQAEIRGRFGFRQIS